jgi:hypothetical protein
MYAIAKINKNDFNFSSLFGGSDTPPITFATDKLFDDETLAEEFINTELQLEADKKALTAYDNGTDVEKDEWKTMMEEDERVCMVSYRYLIIPVSSFVEILGRPDLTTI